MGQNNGEEWTLVRRRNYRKRNRQQDDVATREWRALGPGPGRNYAYTGNLDRSRREIQPQHNMESGRRDKYTRSDRCHQQSRELPVESPSRAPRRHFERQHPRREIGDWWRKKRQHPNASQTDMHGSEHTNRREFIQKVRLFYKIIKTVHHYRNVTQTQAPKAIRQITHSLMNTIKPAMSTDLTADLIQGNARNWECTTIIILTDHYKNLLDILTKELYNHSVEDWRDSFRVAATWSKRRLGRRLLPESVREAEEIIWKNFNNREDRQTETRVIITSLQNKTPTRSIRRKTLPASPPLDRSVTVTAQIHRAAGSSPDEIITSPEDSPGLHYIAPQHRRWETTTTRRTPEALDSPKQQRIRRRGHREEQTSRSTETIKSRTRRDKERPEEDSGTHLTIAEGTPQARREADTRNKTSLEWNISSTEDSGEDLEERAGNSRPPSRNRAQQTSYKDFEKLKIESAQTLLHTAMVRPTKHIITDRKKTDWELNILGKYIIIGDSNVSKFAPLWIPDAQIDSFPGATFRHIHGVLEKIDPNLEVQIVIFSLGINNRKQKLLTAIKEVQRLYKISIEKFPNAEIIFPLLNYAKNLPFREQEFLQALNRHLKQKYMYLPELPKDEFMTERDGIHWTQKTADRILQQWVQQGNYRSP